MCVKGIYIFPDHVCVCSLSPVLKPTAHVPRKKETPFKAELKMMTPVTSSGEQCHSPLRVLTIILKFLCQFVLFLLHCSLKLHFHA